MAELKVLVLGDGLLGKEIVNQTGWNFISRKKDSLDIDNFSSFHNELKKYNVLVNCIANTDTYSGDKESHWKANYVFVDMLIKFCNENNIKLVHISTDYLYTGSVENATEEDVPVHCNTWYGYTKLLSDGLVQLQSKNYLLIRCSHKPKPFPYEKAWIDIIGNFDYVDVISYKIIELIRSELSGLFNVGTELKTMYDLAKKTNPTIECITSNIKVPKNTSLNISKMKNVLNKKSFFSIAIPTYEMHGVGVEFLNHSFNILYTQTFTDFEVVVSDHSKNDDIEIMCEVWSKKLNIKYIRNTENLGSSSHNINNAIKNSNGEWIKLLWQDDFLYSSDSLKDIYDEIQNNKDHHWIVTASEHTFDGINYYMPYYPNWNDNIQYGQNTISSPSVLCIKNEDLLFFDERLIWLMDVDYYKQLYDRWGLPIFYQKINVVNRVWSNQLSNTISQERKELEYILMLEKYNNYTIHMTRTEIINSLIKKYKYESYLEIGVNTPAQPGYNWVGVNIPLKHGVDPNVDTTYRMTSDEFFEKHISQKYDIIFIDGLHIFEQVYKDIINSLNYLNDNGIIVVHDCNPVTEITQRRIRASDAWHGDVWKSIVKLRIENSNLDICTVNTDEGCGIIRKGVQKLLIVDENVDVYDYKFLEENRKIALNLISVDQFKEKYTKYD